MNVETILGRKGKVVFTVSPDTTISRAAQLLREKRIGAVVVSSDGAQVLGILSERDIVHGLAERGAAVLELPVDELMTHDVETCTGEDTGGELLALMTDRRFRHLPVLENGSLAGIVSIGDVVKSRLDEIMREAEALRDYIALG